MDRQHASSFDFRCPDIEKSKLDGTGVPYNIEVRWHLDSILDAPISISNLTKSRNIKVPVFYLGGRGADRYKRLLRGFTDD